MLIGVCFRLCGVQIGAGLRFGVVWLVLFGLLVSRSPETHPYISKAERDHIVGTRRATLGDAGTATGFCEVPWTAFFRHPPFWGTVIAHFCYNYMSFLALSLGPCGNFDIIFALDLQRLWFWTAKFVPSLYRAMRLSLTTPAQYHPLWGCGCCDHFT